MKTGRVKWFDAVKGYGFITADDGSGDAFVHQTDIVAKGYRTLSEGDLVEFEPEPGDRGIKARNVRALTGTQDPVKHRHD